MVYVKREGVGFVGKFGLLGQSVVSLRKAKNDLRVWRSRASSMVFFICLSKKQTNSQKKEGWHWTWERFVFLINVKILNLILDMNSCFWRSTNIYLLTLIWKCNSIRIDFNLHFLNIVFTMSYDLAFNRFSSISRQLLLCKRFDNQTPPDRRISIHIEYHVERFIMYL